MYDSIEKTYLYNPFDVKLWSDEMIEKQVRQLLPRYKHDDDTMYGMASNVETLANIMYLFGEMIARLTKDYGLSNLNISNINAGYTFPVKWWNGHIQNLRVYVACDNVWYWSKRQGFDPRGGSNNYYAPIRTISGGVTLTF